MIEWVFGGGNSTDRKEEKFWWIDFFGWSATTHSYNGRSTDQMGPTEGWSRQEQDLELATKY